MNIGPVMIDWETNLVNAIVAELLDKECNYQKILGRVLIRIAEIQEQRGPYDR